MTTIAIISARQSGLVYPGRRAAAITFAEVTQEVVVKVILFVAAKGGD